MKVYKKNLLVENFVQKFIKCLSQKLFLNVHCKRFPKNILLIKIFFKKNIRCHAYS